ncbi:probable disease resistance protein At4g27220 [Chenopodium quinoa]|uniref:probable disease resistance protein At4g27220 n=1 Tax=Chenopodium quinoa TaxID=63459 RepID=UPI000B774D5B|nr:probable disease resistance protein At4g27220 [Chenopodium quinoa]
MSKKAKSKADEIDAIINKKPNDVTEPVSRLDLKSIPNEFLKGLRSRVELIEEILKRLRDDKVDAVGIFGMGAIGKTTLVTEILNHKDIKTMFKEIIMVEISEAPNMERIQDQIAEKVGLKLDGVHSVEQRRTSLYNRLERVSKILIILDNVWAKLDLNKVGIPKPHVNQNKFCKILVTSREKNVCEAMEISKNNIFEVKPLDYDESKQLFRARIGAKINDDGWKDPQREDMEKRMLNRCGGLPLAIVALADVLKNEESLEAWKHFASDLEKPMSNSLAKSRGVHRQAYTILETSYKLMEDEKKKRFFLLACLFPFGARIPIEDMMRYGIGLELLENVDNLIEAMEQANRWVEELKSSSLLLEDEDYKQIHVKIHDVVRASTIFLAEQGGDMIMVEGFPRWMSLKSCSKYYAISLMSGSNHSRLNKLNYDKLRILILDHTRGEFEDTFFQGMKYLMVLVLRGMKLKPKLPSSMLNLKSSLTTLIMENCELGDITGIGELTNLVVLSLRRSFIVEISEAIGNLCNLRFLDLTECSIERNGIAANVLSKLSLLEGLYALNGGSEPWRYNNNNDDSKKGEYSSYARFAELNYLSFLKLLQLHVAFNDWPIDDHQLQFLSNLDHFRICFGYCMIFPRGYSRALSGIYDDSWSSIVRNNGVRVLLEKTQYLRLEWMTELKHINDEIQQQEEDETKMQLSNIHFPHSQQLDVRWCPKMQSLSSTPFQAPNLTPNNKLNNHPNNNLNNHSVKALSKNKVEDGVAVIQAERSSRGKSRFGMAGWGIRGGGWGLWGGLLFRGCWGVFGVAGVFGMAGWKIVNVDGVVGSGDGVFVVAGRVTESGDGFSGWLGGVLDWRGFWSG